MLSRTSNAFSSPGLTTWYLSRVIVSFAMVAALALSLPSAASAHVDTESAAGGESRPGPSASQVSRTVVASGLNNPRHMTIGPDGTIYLAESGTGGPSPCSEGPEGEECFGLSASVTAITDSGQQTIAEGLPSLAGEGGFASTGVSDVAVAADGTVRALIGLARNPVVRADVFEPAGGALLGQVVNIQPDGSAVAVLDVAAFEASDNPDGGEVDSNPTALIPTDGGYLIVDAGANALYSFDGTTLSTVAVFPDVLVPAPPFIPVPEIPMQAVPTSVAVGPDGAYYVGQLTGFPFPPGMAQVFRVDPDSGDVTVYADGFTNIIDIEFAPDGTLYVLQISSSGLLSGEFDGALHKVGSDGASEVVEEDLFAPGGLAISAEGDVYVSNCGICPGAGEVLLLTDGAPDFDVAYTTGSDRSAATPLAGAEISGPAYVFVSPLAPSADIRRVEFVLDDAPFRTEFLAPYDFAARAAGPWDSASVADGSHTITAVAVLADGSTAVSSATFTTTNGVAPVDSGLAYSNDRQRSNSLDLNGAVIEGTIWAYVFPIFPPGHESVENVAFTLDGEAFRTEFLAPYDFAGSGPGWDTTTVADGEHTIVATATITGGPPMMATATFTVANDGPPPPPEPPVDPEAAGFLTDEDPFITLDPALPGDATVKALISSGETLGDFTFEGLPDGIGIRPGPDPDTVEVYVAHEQTTIPFFGSRDFQGASVSRLTLSTIVGEIQGAILDADVALSPDAGFLRFCSASMAGPDEGLEDYVFFTGEETNDTVDGTQRGFAVALNTRTGEHVAVPGMGRLNHESVVVVPGGWDDLAMLTTDDTFSAPSSQLYMYLAEDQDAIFDDTGSLYALRITGVDGTPLADATDPQNGANDYLDLDVGEEFQAEFIPVPRDVAVGDQTALEDWSNANNVYQSIRLEDAAVDKSDGRVVYIADTGATRVLPDPATGQMMRGPSGTVGSADNGRIFKMVMNADDPTIVDSLSILADGDAVGTDVYVPFTSPDNIDTSTQSLMVQEDTDGAQIWQLSFGDNSWRSVATINDPDGESSGIVDASAWFGSGSWLLDVQGHGVNVEEETVEEILIKRESGQLMLLSIPGS